MPRAPDPDEILEIGRISKLRPEIDQAHSDSTDTISDQMKKRMSVIDLIPCIFNVDYSNILNTDQAVADRFKPTMSFEKPVKDYRSICKTYGLKPYSFLRLYLTDMTSVTDDFNNEYMKSVIDDAIGSLTGSKLGQLFSGLQKTSYSMGTGSPNTIIDNLKDASNSMGIQVSQNLLDNLNLTADVLTHGTRIAFPKIWNSASYTPNLSCDIKLVSPYGHP